MVNIGNDWDELLADEWGKEYYQNLRKFLKREYATRTIYPDMHDIFNALKFSSYKDTKVVILGQDPYHGEKQAHGLCFSVKKGIKPPPSLQNIFKEIQSELGIEIPKHGELTSWAEQGILMLNTCLTVRAGEANSHRGQGWEELADKIVATLNDREEPIVFVLWGNPAKHKARLVTNSQHLILTAAHPSPLSAHNGFFGCSHFSKINEFLESNGADPINWTV